MKSETSVTSSVRIIGGQLRSRKINFPAISDLRPTSDRVRETLFNWLQFDLAGGNCLDLFAGSGALGIECLSRGASKVTFIEKHHQAFAAIKENLSKLKLSNGDVVCNEALAWLSSSKPGQDKFDVVFIDPPFAADILVPVCDRLSKSCLLNPGCKIYIESGKELSGLQLPEHWLELKHKKAGQVYFKLYRNEIEE